MTLKKQNFFLFKIILCLLCLNNIAIPFVEAKFDQDTIEVASDLLHSMLEAADDQAINTYYLFLKKAYDSMCCQDKERVRSLSTELYFDIEGLPEKNRDFYILLGEMDVACFNQFLVSVLVLYDQSSKDIFFSFFQNILRNCSLKIDQYTNQSIDFLSDVIAILIKYGYQLHGPIFITAVKHIMCYYFYNDCHMMNDLFMKQIKTNAAFDPLEITNLILDINQIKEYFLNPDQGARKKLRFISSHFLDLAHLYPIHKHLLSITKQQTREVTVSLLDYVKKIDQIDENRLQDSPFVGQILKGCDAMALLYYAIDMEHFKLYKLLIENTESYEQLDREEIFIQLINTFLKPARGSTLDDIAVSQLNGNAFCKYIKILMDKDPVENMEIANNHNIPVIARFLLTPDFNKKNICIGYLLQAGFNLDIPFVFQEHSLTSQQILCYIYSEIDYNMLKHVSQKIHYNNPEWVQALSFECKTSQFIFCLINILKHSANAKNIPMFNDMLQKAKNAHCFKDANFIKSCQNSLESCMFLPCFYDEQCVSFRYVNVACFESLLKSLFEQNKNDFIVFFKTILSTAAPCAVEYWSQNRDELQIFIGAFIDCGFALWGCEFIKNDLKEIIKDCFRKQFYTLNYLLINQAKIKYNLALQLDYTDFITLDALKTCFFTATSDCADKLNFISACFTQLGSIDVISKSVLLRQEKQKYWQHAMPGVTIERFKDENSQHCQALYSMKLSNVRLLGIAIELNHLERYKQLIKNAMLSIFDKRLILFKLIHELLYIPPVNWNVNKVDYYKRFDQYVKILIMENTLCAQAQICDSNAASLPIIACWLLAPNMPVDLKQSVLKSLISLGFNRNQPYVVGQHCLTPQNILNYDTDVNMSYEDLIAYPD
ncbi:MAG: hypothetical protein HAW62_04000 [Endozoicomonadaceae bacterium]|nr:hypothetical protein [Endozoicomonadaceae bacterium]